MDFLRAGVIILEVVPNRPAHSLPAGKYEKAKEWIGSTFLVMYAVAPAQVRHIRMKVALFVVVLTSLAVGEADGTKYCIPAAPIQIHRDVRRFLC